VLEDEAEVAYAFNQYHLISAPVVDADNRLVGVITIDDAMGILDEEHEEDILRLAGVGESSLSDKAWDTMKRRAPWLAVNLVTAILASAVIAQYSEIMAQFVALALLMPIVASMGGNAGTQSLTVAVRAIATRDLTRANVWRVIRRETLVGLMNGAVFAVVPLVKRRLTGQIAGMTGAYGNVGGVMFLTILSFVSPMIFFLVIAASSLLTLLVVSLFMEEPEGHMVEVLPDGTVQMIEVT
jgi:Mg/Co/Ni transporter MgtE